MRGRAGRRVETSHLPHLVISSARCQLALESLVMRSDQWNRSISRVPVHALRTHRQFAGSLGAHSQAVWVDSLGAHSQAVWVSCSEAHW